MYQEKPNQGIILFIVFGFYLSVCQIEIGLIIKNFDGGSYYFGIWFDFIDIQIRSGADIRTVGWSDSADFERDTISNNSVSQLFNAIVSPDLTYHALFNLIHTKEMIKQLFGKHCSIETIWEHKYLHI